MMEKKRFGTCVADHIEYEVVWNGQNDQDDYDLLLTNGSLAVKRLEILLDGPAPRRPFALGDRGPSTQAERDAELTRLILGALREQGGMRLSNIARVLKCSQAIASRLLGKLILHGQVVTDTRNTNKHRWGMLYLLPSLSAVSLPKENHAAL